MKKNKLQKGISLIETIVYVAIFNILVVGLVQYASSLSFARLHMQSVLEVNDQGSRVLKLITQSIRDASSVNTPVVGNNGSSLSIATNTPATSPTIFSLNSGVIYIKEGSGSLVALTNSRVVASSLSFSNLSLVGSQDIIRVSFTLSNQDVRDPYSMNFVSSAALRK